MAEEERKLGGRGNGAVRGAKEILAVGEARGAGRGVGGRGVGTSREVLAVPLIHDFFEINFGR